MSDIYVQNLDAFLSESRLKHAYYPLRNLLKMQACN